MVGEAGVEDGVEKEKDEGRGAENGGLRRGRWGARKESRYPEEEG